MSNNLDPDQDRQNVRPDLGPNGLQRLSAGDKSPLARKELKVFKQLFELRHVISNNVVF